MEPLQRSRRDALDEARDAFRKDNFPQALEKYDYFFEQGLDDDPHSLYGVRLSYCLSEWAELGSKYPEALTRLAEKKATALSLLGQTRRPERFHDFVAICRHLKCEDEPIRAFLILHSSDRELAAAVVSFIWDPLVKAKQWEVCSSYLPTPIEHYKHALMRFDNAMEVCKSDPALGGEEFERQIKGWYVRDVSNMILVLNNNGRSNELTPIEERILSDTQSRGCSELVSEINELIAL